MVGIGEWYAFGERDNPTLRPRIIDGRRFFRGLITTIKTRAEASAEGYRKRGHFARIIPLMLWGKRRGYAIPEKRQCYVVFHSYSDQTGDDTPHQKVEHGRQEWSDYYQI